MVKSVGDCCCDHNYKLKIINHTELSNKFAKILRDSKNLFAQNMVTLKLHLYKNLINKDMMKFKYQ